MVVDVGCVRRRAWVQICRVPHGVSLLTALINLGLGADEGTFYALYDS